MAVDSKTIIEKLQKGVPIIQIANELGISYQDCCRAIRGAGYKLDGEKNTNPHYW
jgi:hypothetical protein